MYRIIGGDQKEYGPVTAQEVRLWIAEGRLNGQSQIRAEASTEWKPLAALAEFGDALQAQSGQVPGSTLPPMQAETWTAQILARQPEISIGQCLGGGFHFLLSNPGLVIGAVLVVSVLNGAMAFIPVVGGLVHLVLSGVLLGGLYLTCLRRLRGEAVAVGNVFDGFRLCFVQLMLAGAVSRLLTQIGWALCALPGAYLAVAWIFALPLVADKRLEFWSAMELSRKVVTRVWFPMFGLLVVTFLPFLLFQVFVSLKMGWFIYGLLQQAHFDLMQLANVFGQHTAELVKLGVQMALLSQFVLALNMFFAVGVLIQAYETLFGARPSSAP